MTSSGESRGLALLRLVPMRGADGKAQSGRLENEGWSGDRGKADAESPPQVGGTLPPAPEASCGMEEKRLESTIQVGGTPQAEGPTSEGNWRKGLTSVEGLTEVWPGERIPTRSPSGSHSVEQPEGEGQKGDVEESTTMHRSGKVRQASATAGGLIGVCPEEGAPTMLSDESRGWALLRLVPMRVADGKAQTGKLEN